VGQVSITLTAPADIADEAEGAFGNTTVTIYQGGSDGNTTEVNVDPSLSYTAIEWFLDSKSLGTNTSVTLTAANLLPGGHHLSLEVTTTDGAVWSRELTVIVDSGSK
jgi:hypothetical protein